MQDTTEFSFKRKYQELIGLTHKSFCGKDKLQRSRLKIIGGIYMHSSLAITPEGLPLGLTPAKLWTRKEFKDTNQLKKRVNPTRIPMEKKESIK